MKGDYYCYLVEVVIGDDKKCIIDLVWLVYQEVMDISKKEMLFINFICLGLVLNFFVFYYEIVNSFEEVIFLVKIIFDEVMVDLYIFSEDFYKDSIFIMQLFRDNLIFWILDSVGEECDVVEGVEN